MALPVIRLYHTFSLRSRHSFYQYSARYLHFPFLIILYLRLLPIIKFLLGDDDNILSISIFLT